MCSYGGYQGTLMRHDSAIPWKAVYAVQLMNVCGLNKKTIGGQL
jgi:hypothetical protein